MGENITVKTEDITVRLEIMDLTMCYKIIFGLVNVNCINFFQLSPSSHTRGHAYKLYKQRSLTNTGTAFFELLMCGITYHMIQLISPQ